MIKTTLLIIVTCCVSNLFSQDFCTIKLVDAYSYEQIDASKIVYLSQENYRIDSSNSLVILDQPKGKKISIVALNFETTESEIKFNTYLGDTLVIQMKPVDSILQIRFNELYATSLTVDTIKFESPDQFNTHLNVYLNYLKTLNGKCGNGMCNYANTYSYMIEFIQENGVYRMGSITKLQPREYQCTPLDDALNQLKNNFPKFQLAGETDEMTRRFTIILN